PVIVENDVNLAAQGERWRVHGVETSNFAFFALGTGVGMGIIANDHGYTHSVAEDLPQIDCVDAGDAWSYIDMSGGR
ncbi:ROK family protein, partial [Rhizobium ruizarguesonis]